MFMYILSADQLILKLSFQNYRKPEDEQVSGPMQITAIVAYSKGFACACGPGTVHLFEKTDEKDFFKKAREIKVGLYELSCMIYAICCLSDIYS